MVGPGKLMSAQTKHTAINLLESQLHDSGNLSPVVSDALAAAHVLADQYEIILYVAGALTGVALADKQRYELVARTATAIRGERSLFAYVPHMHGTDPVVHPDITPAEVRTIDFLASAVIADAQLNFTYPLAHGNAIELAWAEAAGIPTWLIVPDTQHTSRLTRGMQNIAGTITYHDFAVDGIIQVTSLLRSLATGSATS